MSSATPKAEPIETVPAVRARCLDRAETFQHPLLEEPPAGGAPAVTRRAYATLEHQAAETCRTCPLLAQCLYEAVVLGQVPHGLEVVGLLLVSGAIVLTGLDREEPAGEAPPPA